MKAIKRLMTTSGRSLRSLETPATTTRLQLSIWIRGDSPSIKIGQKFFCKKKLWFKDTSPLLHLTLLGKFVIPLQQCVIFTAKLTLKSLLLISTFVHLRPKWLCNERFFRPLLTLISPSLPHLFLCTKI